MKNRIRRVLGLSWVQVNDYRGDSASHLDRVTWRIKGDPADAGNWALLTVAPRGVAPKGVSGAFERTGGTPIVTPEYSIPFRCPAALVDHEVRQLVGVSLPPTAAESIRKPSPQKFGPPIMMPRIVWFYCVHCRAVGSEADWEPCRPSLGGTP